MLIPDFYDSVKSFIQIDFSFSQKLFIVDVDSRWQRKVTTY